MILSTLRIKRSTPTQLGMITPEQMLAARALLRWTRDDLADKSGVAAITAMGFELRRTDPKVSTVQKWRRALEAAGIEFIDESTAGGVGVRLRPGVKLSTVKRGAKAKR
jgi:transcriptional regulator with XRE-family HTH domain